MLLAHAGELHEETNTVQPEHSTGQVVANPFTTTRTLNPVTVTSLVVVFVIIAFVVYKLFTQKAR